MRHIGIAWVISSPAAIATPLQTLSAKQGAVAHDQLDALVADHAPNLFVVGLPLNMDGTPSTQTKRAKRFGNHLSKRYHRSVEFVDERLTTREAIDRTNNPKPDHSLAALVIAETWLHERHSE